MSSRPMSCRDVLDFLAAYLDGELGTRVREAFERHLARCPACVSYLESYRETIRVGREAHAAEGAVVEEIPEGLIDAILGSRRTP